MAAIFSVKQSSARKKAKTITLRAFTTRFILLCVLPLFLLALCLAAAHVYTLQTRQAREMRAQAHNVMQAVDRDLSARISALQVLAGSPLIDDTPRLEEFYKEAQGFRKSFTGHVILADMSTRMVFNTRVPFGTELPLLPVPKGFAAAPFVMKTGKPAVGDMFPGPIAREPLVAIVVPVTHAGKIQALLLSIVETAQYQALLDDLAISGGYCVTLVDSKQAGMAHRNMSDGEKTDGDTDPGKKITVKSSVSHWEVVLDAASRDYFRPVFMAGAGLLMAVVLVVSASIIGGRLMGEKLVRFVASLTGKQPSGTFSETIAEIEEVRSVLDKAARDRERSMERYRLLFENMNEGFVLHEIITDDQSQPVDFCILEINPAAEHLTGLQRSEVIGRRVSQMETEPAWTGHYIRVARSGEPVRLQEYSEVLKKWFDLFVFQPKPGYCATVFSDITGRIKLENQIRQTRKMEAVGTLAGGVAHDYNNMLSVIVGYTQIALDKTEPSGQLHADLMEVMNAAERSVDITRQLLAFARKQTIAPKVLNLNETVDGMLKMLRRLISEEIDLAWQPDCRVWPVHMDPSQIDQVLVNLCVNARDAIEGGGKLIIETKNATLDAAYCSEHPGACPGDFVMLAVSDDGCGMDRQTLDNIFEPFFTTKEIGCGTGLGLSTVYGIVKQNNGVVDVSSEQGQGTIFRIYLPRHQGKVEEMSPGEPDAMPRGSGQTILVVEDEVSILQLAEKLLEGLGYTVITADTPQKAISLARSLDRQIHLLITDVILPEMNGRELAEQIRAVHPGIKVLFMSGYTANVIAHHGVLEKTAQFVSKPFTREKLAVKVRQALEGEMF
jgi:PAS domain S-box-containing protein